MRIDKAENRDKKRFKKQHGMQVSNKSVFLLNDISTGKKKKKNRKGKVIDNTEN